MATMEYVAHHRKRHKRGKTGLSREQWQKIFGETAKQCAAEAEAAGLRGRQRLEAQRACMRERLTGFKGVA